MSDLIKLARLIYQLKTTMIANQTIVVHVAGAVEKPEVYEMQEGDRIYQAIEKALPKTEADINLLNLASHLSDGQKIVVPKKAKPQPLVQ